MILLVGVNITGVIKVNGSDFIIPDANRLRLDVVVQQINEPGHIQYFP